MRTTIIEVYKFEELTKNAQAVSIKEVRGNYYKYNDFLSWVIDDCYLLEPLESELKEVGYHNETPLIINTRALFVSLDINKYVDISNAMKIEDDYYFLKWLGLSDELIKNVSYIIGTDYIEIIEDDLYSTQFTDVEWSSICDEIGRAQNKFSRHCEEVLSRIEKDWKYRFTDEAIKRDIESNEYEFLKDGKIHY